MGKLLNNLPALIEGLGVTLNIALISIGISIAFGIIFGCVRISKNKVIAFISRGYIEIFRIIPLVVLLFLVFFGLPILFEIHMSGIEASIIVFSLWGISEMGEIFRGAVEAIPKAQIESAKALGLKKTQIYRYILIPQATKIMIPGSINLSTRILKTTSITVLIGVVEVVKKGQQIIERTKEPFGIYLFLFIVFFSVCYPLSLVSKRLELKWRY